MEYLGLLLYIILVNFSSGNIYLPCSEDNDCNLVVPESICYKPFNYCHCPAGKTFSSDVTKCIDEKFVGEKCDEANQCSHMLTGAQCNVNCECANGFTFVGGRCRELIDLHENCTNDIDCFFGYNRESVVCQNGKCECAEGFYERSTNVCRRKVSNGVGCLVNQDCFEADAQCVNRICQSVSTQTITFKNAAVQTHNLDSFKENFISNLNKINPLGNQIFKNINNNQIKRNETSTRDTGTQYGDLCSNEQQPCLNLKYSICRRGLCQCRNGFYPNAARVCVAELGEVVLDKDDCGGGTYDEKSGRCVCSNVQFYNPNMRTCLKSATGFNMSCTQPSQCSPYGASYCNRNCLCYDYADYNPETEMCELKKGLNEFCKEITDCSVENTICSNGNSCICKENHVELNGDCKPGIGATCKDTKNCAVPNSECKIEIVDEKEEESCSCADEYVEVNESCLEKAKSYNDTCSDSDQCKPLLGDKASCIDTKCICDETLQFKDGQCHDKRELNEQCSRSSECFVKDETDGVECRNNVCQCKFNYETNAPENRCSRPRQSKNSSNTTSPLKVITLLLIASAVLITGSALKDAYYP